MPHNTIKVLTNRVEDLERVNEQLSKENEQMRKLLSSLIHWPQPYKALLAAGAAKQVSEAEFFLDNQQKTVLTSKNDLP